MRCDKIAEPEETETQVKSVVCTAQQPDFFGFLSLPFFFSLLSNEQGKNTQLERGPLPFALFVHTHTQDVARLELILSECAAHWCIKLSNQILRKLLNRLILN